MAVSFGSGTSPSIATPNPVTLGEHRMLFRPRESHDLRLLDATLAIRREADLGAGVLQADTGAMLICGTRDSPHLPSEARGASARRRRANLSYASLHG